MIIELHLGRIVRKNSSSLDRKNFRLDFTYIPTKSIFFFNRKIQYITKKLVYKVDVQRHTQEIPEPHQRKKKKTAKVKEKTSKSHRTSTKAKNTPETPSHRTANPNQGPPYRRREERRATPKRRPRIIRHHTDPGT